MFTVPSWQAPDDPPLRADTQQAPPEWLDKAQTLHTAKKQATSSFSRFSMQPQEQRLQDAWARDEKAVLRARADLLNTLMTAEQDPKLCLEVKSKNRVCVMYNRMRCEGDVELGPMQSTMSWVVHGGERAYQQLITAGVHAQPGVMRALLRAVQRSMPPRKDTLQPLSAVLSKSCPDTLTPKTEAGLLGAEPGQTRVMEGLCKHGRQEAPTYRLVWGALDVNAQEAWQNPSTNASIRLSILETAHAATREAARSKQPLWSSVTHLQVKILHNDECHSLTIVPFCNSEACTVTHLQFVQSVFDASGPERGILNLSQNPEAVHPIPLGRISPMQSYVCLKAHKSGRLNEAQLNYVHSRGLLEHPGFDVALLPSASRLFFSSSSSNGAMPPAKSTRISGTGVDVLASSYHLADQVFTTMTVVQYPPFGTQFGPALNEGEEDEEDNRDEEPYEDYNDEEDAHDDDEYDNQSFQSMVFEPDDKEEWNAGHREELGKRDKILVNDKREVWDLKDEKTGLLKHKPDRWGEILLKDQSFFIDGYLGDPYYDCDPYDKNKRWILFEIDNGTRYQKVQSKLLEIRGMLIKKMSQQWNPNISFYENLRQNKSIHQIWKRQWQDFLAEHIDELQDEFQEYCDRTGNDPKKHPRHAFWYNGTVKSWVSVFVDMMTNEDRRLWNEENQALDKNSTFGRHVRFYSQKGPVWIKHWVDKGRLIRPQLDALLGSKLTDSLINGTPVSKQKFDRPAARIKNFASSKIPTPIRQSLQKKPQNGKTPRDKEDSTQTSMKARIASLESKLLRVQKQDNTQHLLRQVLERLDDAS